MANGDKLALAAVAGLAFISALSRKRRGAKNEAKPFDPLRGFPLIYPISEDKIKYGMGGRYDYSLGPAAHVIDEDALQWFEDEGGETEGVYGSLEHEHYVYIPTSNVDIRSLLEEPGAVSKRVRKTLEVREIVLPEEYPGTRAGEAVDVVFFNSALLYAAMFLDRSGVYLGHSAYWLRFVADYYETDGEPGVILDLFTTMHRMMNGGGNLTWSDEAQEKLRQAVDLFGDNEDKLTAAVLSILIGEEELGRENLNQAQVLSLIKRIGKDGLLEVLMEFPHGFENSASALGRPMTTLGGVRVPFALAQGSRSKSQRSS